MIDLCINVTLKKMSSNNQIILFFTLSCVIKMCEFEKPCLILISLLQIVLQHVIYATSRCTQSLQPLQLFLF